MTRVMSMLGGGSAYAPGLVQALLHHASQHQLTELRLHDVDVEKLEVVARLASRMAEASGGPFAVTATVELDEALKGVQVVLNSTRPGGLASRHLDETLPLEFDIPGQETVGPGGFFFALRSVPYTLRVAERMAALAPGAVLLNYTNPTNIVCQALASRTRVRVLGLCDQSDEDLETLARALGRERAPSFSCVGLNHATWYSDIVDADRRPLLLEAARVPEVGLDDEHLLRFVLSRELAKRAGRGWPNSYLPYYTHPSAFVDLARRRGSRARIIGASLPAYYEHFEHESRKVEPQLSRHRGAAGFGDLAVRTLSALANDQAARLVLNVPNQGCTAHFDEATVVEVPVVLGPLRMEPAPPADVPTFLAPLLRRLERYQLAASEVAAAGRSEETLIDALAENPLVPNRGVARALFDRARRAYEPGILGVNA